MNVTAGSRKVDVGSKIHLELRYTLTRPLVHPHSQRAQNRAILEIDCSSLTPCLSPASEQSKPGVSRDGDRRACDPVSGRFLALVLEYTRKSCCRHCS